MILVFWTAYFTAIYSVLWAVPNWAVLPVALLGVPVSFAVSWVQKRCHDGAGAR